MPDLNELLRWSIANSTQLSSANDQTQPPQPAEPASEQQLSLSFRPTQTPHAASSRLHPSDPQYRSASDDISPASTPGPATPTGGSSTLPTLPRRQELNTEILDLIMGEDDSVTMRDKMRFAVDSANPLDQRVEALDDFEMLVESLDNANNMAVLKLWEPLLGLLEDVEDEVVTQAAWIVGTAVQNNLKAQAALYIHNALPQILSLIYPSTGTARGNAVRAKATYALSSALKHWPLASSALSSSSSEGYTVLRRGVADASTPIRRKMAFLVGTLVMQSDEPYTGEIPGEVESLIREHSQSVGSADKPLLQGLQGGGIFSALLAQLQSGSEEADIEYEENAMRALSQAAAKGALGEDEKKALRDIWEKWGAAGQEERGLSGEDGKVIAAALA